MNVAIKRLTRCPIGADVIHNNSHVIYYAIGRPQITAYVSVLRFCILVPLTLVLVPDYGTLGAAWALVITNWFVIFIEYAVFFRVVSITLVDIVSIIWRSTVAVLFMAVCVTVVLNIAPHSDLQWSLVLHLIYSVGTGVLSYVMAILVLWFLSGKPDGPEAHALLILQRIFSRQMLLNLRNRSIE